MGTTIVPPFLTYYTDIDCDEVEPLLKTEWAQFDNYNDSLPDMGCSENNGRPLAGCAVITIAQIIKYYRHPNTYDWDKMKDKESTPETAKLIRDIGKVIGVKYGCKGSSASTLDASKLLTSKYGYATNYSGAYSDDITIQELKAKRPVILMGGRKKADGGSARHSWICDGFLRDIYYHNGKIDRIWISLHMNWGWGKGVESIVKYNGWFDHNNWNSALGAYNENKKMIYGIKPRK